MFQRLYLILLLILAAFSTVYSEQRDKIRLCNRTGVQVDETNRKFSVLQPGYKYGSYNDIGCALLWRQYQCHDDQATFDSTAKAYDYFDGTEVPLKDAFFVMDSGIATPVGFGIIAFRSKESAEKFVGEQKAGKVVLYNDLILMSME